MPSCAQCNIIAIDFFLPLPQGDVFHCFFQRVKFKTRKSDLQKYFMIFLHFVCRIFCPFCGSEFFCIIYSLLIVFKQSL